MVDKVTYADRTITIDDILNARTAIEEMAMAHKESACSNVIHVGGTTTTVEAVRDVCTLATAMWYRIKTIDD